MLFLSSGHFLSSTNSPGEREEKNGSNIPEQSESELEDLEKGTHELRMKSKWMKRGFAVRKCNNGHRAKRLNVWLPPPSLVYVPFLMFQNYIYYPSFVAYQHKSTFTNIFFLSTWDIPFRQLLSLLTKTFPLERRLTFLYKVHQITGFGLLVSRAQ